MTGSNVWIDLNPAGTGSKTIISIVPTAALIGASTWQGIYISGASLDPVDVNALILGLNIALEGVLMTNQPYIRGIQLVMPAAYNSADAAAMYISGDGKVVRICDDDYALHVDAGIARFDGIVYLGNGTTYYIDASGNAKFLIAADDTTYTGIVTNDSGILKYRTKAQILSDIAASPVAGSVSIVTVGTIATGVWQGTIIDPAFLDQSDLLYAADASYVHKVSAAECWVRDDLNLLITCDEDGLRSTATSGVYIRMVTSPPDWLIKYADDNGLTITVTNLTINWNDTNLADYLTRLYVYWTDGDSASKATLLNDATNKGQGTVGFRSDAYNITDHTIAAGDWISILASFTQGSSESCRIFSLEMTYTIT